LLQLHWPWRIILRKFIVLIIEFRSEFHFHLNRAKSGSAQETMTLSRWHMAMNYLFIASAVNGVYVFSPAMILDHVATLMRIQDDIALKPVFYRDVLMTYDCAVRNNWERATIQNLDDFELKTACRSKDQDTLTTCMQIHTIRGGVPASLSLDDAVTTERPKAKPQPKGPKGSCFECGEAGHHRDNCPLLKTRGAAPPAKFFPPPSQG
jgi:hypothetical protein